MVSGHVTSDCEGPRQGVVVTLVDGAGQTLTTTTVAGGAYVFADVGSSANPGQISIAVPAGFAAAAPAGGQTSVALEADIAVEFSVECIFVSISGTVTSDCRGAVSGATVTLVDGAGSSSTTTTGPTGAYSFASVRYSQNPGSVSVTAPAGFSQVPPQSVALTADAQANFALTCTVVSVSGTVNAKLVSSGVIDLSIHQIPYKLAGLTTAYLGVGPTPARVSTNVRFSLTDAQPVVVKVYAVNGTARARDRKNAGCRASRPELGLP